MWSWFHYYKLICITFVIENFSYRSHQRQMDYLQITGWLLQRAQHCIASTRVPTRYDLPQTLSLTCTHLIEGWFLLLLILFRVNSRISIKPLFPKSFLLKLIRIYNRYRAKSTFFLYYIQTWIEYFFHSHLLNQMMRI